MPWQQWQPNNSNKIAIVRYIPHIFTTLLWFVFRGASICCDPDDTKNMSFFIEWNFSRICTTLIISLILTNWAIKSCKLGVNTIHRTNNWWVDWSDGVAKHKWYTHSLRHCAFLVKFTAIYADAQLKRVNQQFHLFPCFAHSLLPKLF